MSKYLSPHMFACASCNRTLWVKELGLLGYGNLTYCKRALCMNVGRLYAKEQYLKTKKTILEQIKNLDAESRAYSHVVLGALEEVFHERE